MEDVQIDMVELAEQPAMVVRREVAKDEIGAALGEIYPRVFQYIQSQGAQPAGMPFMRYLVMGESSFTIAAGIPVASPMAGEGDIEPHALPAGKALTALHRGDYAAVGDVWKQVWARARELGHLPKPVGWDVYTNDPSEVSPEDVETRVYLFLGADED